MSEKKHEHHGKPHDETKTPTYRSVRIPIVATRIDIKIGQYVEDDGKVFNYPFTVLYDQIEKTMVGKVDLGNSDSGTIWIKLDDKQMKPDLSKLLLIGVLSESDWPAVKKAIDAGLPEPGTASNGNGRAIAE